MSKGIDISVIGLGKLGSCLAALLASKKHTVTGIDINPGILKSIKAGKSPFEEKGLKELLQKSGKYLSVHSKTGSHTAASAVIFLVVPTPSNADGSFSLDYVFSTIPGIVNGLKKKKHSFPVLVLTSTVMPGDCEKYIIPRIEKASSMRCGIDFGFCYNPEFIALGSVIDDMKTPDMVLIGESDKKSGKILKGVYASFIENKPSYEVTTLVNAEIIKLSVNTFVTTKISYANMLTQICHQTPGADIDVVTSALGKDSRIGLKYLKGGTSYGGPCFPRDNKAFVKMAADRNVHAYLAKATDATNQEHVNYVCKQVIKLAGKGKKIGILGLSYKPGTPVTEESAGIHTGNVLHKKGYEVGYFDSLVTTVKGFAPKRKSSVSGLLKWADVVILMSNEKEYKSIGPSDLKPGGIVIDCWRILGKSWENYAGWYPIGIGK